MEAISIIQLTSQPRCGLPIFFDQLYTEPATG